MNESSSKGVESETKEKTINNNNKRSLEEDPTEDPNEQLKRSTSNAQVLDLNNEEKPQKLAESLEKKLDTIYLKAFFAEKQGERGENLFISI